MEKFYCANCNAEVDASANVCPKCGSYFDSEPEVIVSQTVTFDDKVKKTVLGLERVADAIKILSIIAAVIVFIVGVVAAGDSEEHSGTILLVYSIYTLLLAANAYISYLVFNWLSHMLNCTYQLTKKKK